MNLKGATALVTGGSSGIGLAIARKLTEPGARVAITGRDEQRLFRYLAVFANGRRVRDPMHYVMRRHDSIVVGYGTPSSFPHRIAVTFPPGL